MASGYHHTVFCSAKRTSCLLRAPLFFPCYWAAAVPGPTLPGNLFSSPAPFLHWNGTLQYPSGTTYPTECNQPCRTLQSFREHTPAVLFSTLRQSFMHESHVLCRGGVHVRIPGLSLLWRGGGVLISPCSPLSGGPRHTSHIVGPVLELGVDWAWGFPFVLLSHGYLHRL